MANNYHQIFRKESLAQLKTQVQFNLLGKRNFATLRV